MATKLDRFPKFINAETVKNQPLALVIDQETVEDITDPKTGKTVEKSVLSFQGTKARLVLNVTNWDSIVAITGSSESDDWSGCEIELFADRAPMGGRIVDCVRVRAPTPKKQRKAKPAAAVAPELEDEVDFNAGAHPLADEEAATLKAAGSGDLDDDIPF
jgi:hypothetical protein